MKKINTPMCAGLMALVILVISCVVVQAEVWTGSGDGVSYEDILNWNPSTAFPGTTRDINGAFTVERNADVTVNRTYVAGGATMNVTGGTHSDGQSGSTIRNYLGWGSEGTVNQSGGSYNIGHILLVGGNNASGDGTYNLSGGGLTVSRGGNSFMSVPGGSSIEVGTGGATGLFNISGGSLLTRIGVGIGATGTFSVQGSVASSIGIGSSGSLDGDWNQSAGGTLRVGIDSLGVTRILIDDEGDNGGAYATFESGSLLDVDYYAGGSGGGTWTVMEVEGTNITDNGLAFAPGVDQNVWSFNIDNSGANGLLTVTATGTPSVVTNVNVSSIAQLRQYAGLDNLTLTMTPGTYWMEGDADPIFLHLTGNNSTYDLTGVHIKVQTAELPGYGSSASVNILRLSGNGSTVDGLTLSMVKDPNNGLIDAFGDPREYSADNGMTVVLVSGSDTTIKNCNITTGGSYPYGYSDAFGKGARPNNGGVTDAAWIAHDKQSGFLITYGASNVVVDNVTLNMRSYGHGFFMQGGAANILFKDCQVLGDTMADSDDIIAHPEYQAWGFATYKQPIPADINISKHEGAIRTYTNNDYQNNGWPQYISNVTVTNCRIERMRAATPIHAEGYARIYDTEAYECEYGFAVTSRGEAIVENCKGDALNGPLVYFQYSVVQPATVDVELTGSAPGKGVWPIALIGGDGNQVTITSTASPGVYSEGAYVNMSQTFREWRHGPNDDPDANNTGNYSDFATGNFITNLTAQPLVFGTGATANTGCVSTGGIINKGTGNEYVGETLVPGPIVVSDTWSPPAVTVFSGTNLVDSLDSLGGSPAGDGGTTISNGTIIVAPNLKLQGEDLLLSGSGVEGQGAVYSDGTPDNQTRLSSSSGSITLAGDTSIGIGISGNELLMGPMGGTGNLTKVGPGTLTMEGGANSFNGSLTISEGWIKARANKAINDLIIASGAGLNQNASAGVNQGTDESTVLDGTIDINSRGTTDTGAFSIHLGSLSGSGVITATSTAAIQTANVNSSTEDSTFAGSVQGRVSLVKNGAGTTLTLSGSSTHTENTVVNDGTLNLTGSIGSGSSVIVNSGAVLSGNGTAAGAVALNTGAEVSAGSDIDTLTLGGLALAGGSSIAVQMDNATGTAGGSGWDLVSVTGALSDGGGAGVITVKLSGLNGTVSNFDNSQSYTWPIVQASSGGSSLSGATFAVDASGFTGSNPLGGGTLSAQVSGDDINLVFTPVDTPPAAPSGLSATAGNGSISLDWADNSEPDLASYSVYRSTTSGSYGAALVTGLAQSDYVDNTAVNGTTYYYVVTAVDAGSNESAVSNEDAATPMASNGSPVFSVDPINEIDADEDVAYSSSIADNASDPDSDPMTFSKVSGPAWLSVASNGALSGTPVNADVGLNAFVVQVDALGGNDTATLNITVNAAPNLPPAFTADPINETNAEEDSAYSGTIADDASDPESDPMTFSKVSGPAWLSVASNGVLSGTPASGDVGLNSFTVQVDATGGSDTATLEITVDAAGGPVVDFAQSESTSQGSVTGGSTADTVSNDNVYEVLTEEQSGGNPSRRRSMLDHTWTFNVSGGELVTFYVEAHHDVNSEGDDFTFSYSTDNVNFTDMVTVTKTADDDTAQFYSLPGSLSGTVYVKVVDTDRTQGNSATDSLYVDALFITSESASTPPGAAANPDPADSSTGVATAPTLSWTAGMLASSHDVYFGTNPNPGAGEFQGNQSAASYAPGTLATSTTYYWAVDEVNGAGTTLGPVWSFTTGAATPEMHVSSIVLSTQKQGKNYKGRATVTIVDSSTGQPVSGATVSGDFTGAFNESGNATTSSSGEVVITTSAKIPLPFSFTFTVTDVTASGYVYNPANNVETSDSGNF